MEKNGNRRKESQSQNKEKRESKYKSLHYRKLQSLGNNELSESTKRTDKDKKVSKHEV